MRVYCSDLVVNFKEKLLNTWKLPEYDKESLQHRKEPVVFFGMYLDHDYKALMAHEGKSYVFWCGSDLLGLLREPRLQNWLSSVNTKHWVENEVEANDLEKLGYEAHIGKSFLDNIEDFFICYKKAEKPNVYLAYHEDREEMYGINEVIAIAPKVNVTFHIFGGIKKEEKNIIWHGKVEESKFNEMIKNYQCGLRPVDHDGFSEITVKSLLMGQYPISKINYKHIRSYNFTGQLIKSLRNLRFKEYPNLEARKYYLKELNKFPWL